MSLAETIAARVYQLTIKQMTSLTTSVRRCFLVRDALYQYGYVLVAFAEAILGVEYACDRWNCFHYI
mgnify:CR=1 FL=1